MVKMFYNTWFVGLHYMIEEYTCNKSLQNHTMKCFVHSASALVHLMLKYYIFSFDKIVVELILSGK